MSDNAPDPKNPEKPAGNPKPAKSSKEGKNVVPDGMKDSVFQFDEESFTSDSSVKETPAHMPSPGDARRGRAAPRTMVDTSDEERAMPIGGTMQPTPSPTPETAAEFGSGGDFDIGGELDESTAEYVRPFDSSAGPIEELVVADSQGEVDLGGKPLGTGDRPSGLDPVADAVESGAFPEKHAGPIAGHGISDSEASRLLHDASTNHDQGAELDMDSVESLENFLADAPTELPSSRNKKAVSKDSFSDISFDEKMDINTALPKTAPDNEDGNLQPTETEIGSSRFDNEPTLHGEDEEDEEEAAAPAKASGGMLAWAGGGGLGALVGAGVTAACFLFLAGDTKPTVPTGRTGGEIVKPPPLPPADPAKLIKSGDFSAAVTALASDEDAEKTLLRGQARTLNALMQRDPKQATLPLDGEIKVAFDDLEKTKDDPRSAFWMGIIYEQTGQVEKARQLYKEMLGKTKDETQKKLLQAASDRLDVTHPAPAAPGNVQSRLDDLPRERRDGVIWLTVLLAGLQAPDEAPGSPKEAGYDFWQAMKAAREGNYSTASKILQNARSTHAAERFRRIYSAQNPNSDPTEDIFLKSCDELDAYWKLRDLLQSKNVIAKGAKDPGAAIDEFVKANAAAGAMVKDALTTLKADKMLAIPAAENDVGRALAQLLTLKNDLYAQAEKSKAALAAAQKETDAAKAQATKYQSDADKAAKALDSADSTLKKSKDETEAARQQVTQLAAEKKAADTVLNELRRKLLEAKIPVPEVESAPKVAPVETPDPALSDRYYASGLNRYNDHQYALAEKDFQEAIRYNEQDARPFYFLGLSRLAQGKVEIAYEDFRTGAKLELMSRPSRPAVSVSLERVQGPARQTVNRFRP